MSHSGGGNCIRVIQGSKLVRLTIDNGYVSIIYGLTFLGNFMQSLYFNYITYTNIADGDNAGGKSMAAGTTSAKRKKKSSISSETTNAKGAMFSGERDSVPSAIELTTGSDAADRGSKETDTSTNPGNRYILFVGNLPYDASAEDILTHFERRGVPMKDIRLLGLANFTC